METPEKIYLHPNIGNREFIKSWLPKPANQESIEYTRTDAFIDKTCAWIKKMFSETDDRFNQDYTDLLINDFKKAMET